MRSLVSLAAIAATLPLAAFAAPPASAAPVTGPALTASASSVQSLALDSRLIRALKSKDHTVVVGTIKIKPLVMADSTVWTSTRRPSAVSLAWSVRDPRSTADRIRVCREDSRSDSGCLTLPLRSTRSARDGVSIRETATGWQVQVITAYDSRSPRECRADNALGGTASVTVELLDGDRRRTLASDESTWRVRCGR